VRQISLENRRQDGDVCDWWVSSELPVIQEFLRSIHTSRHGDTDRRSHARFLSHLAQQAAEEMQWVCGSFHL
jgi:hypothetical protein